MLSVLSAIFGGAIHKVAITGIVIALTVGTVFVIYRSGEDAEVGKVESQAVEQTEKSISEREKVEDDIDHEAAGRGGDADIDRELRKGYSRD